jgi:hypothetical protein
MKNKTRPKKRIPKYLIREGGRGRRIKLEASLGYKVTLSQRIE